MNGISLAYILKNEEAYIERSILSAAPVAFEIVAVDTGSTDSTKMICERLGADIHDLEWTDDFSAARNYAVSKCTGDWILMLDADEHIEGEAISRIPAAIDEANRVGDIVAYQFIRKNHYPSHDFDSPFFTHPFYPDMQTRLFRRMPEIFFSGRVHEGVVQSIEVSSVGGIGRIPVCIHHHMFRGDQERYEREKQAYYDKLSGIESRRERHEAVF
jgi:glycosyltransferase involved in cell wall biosynthesis